MKDEQYIKDFDDICKKKGVKGALDYIIYQHTPGDKEKTIKLIERAKEKLGDKTVFRDLEICIPGLF